MKDNFNIEVGKRIRSSRKNQSITMKELGEKVGLSEGNIQRYEIGKIKGIDINLLMKIADALDVSTQYLMGWDKDATDKNTDFQYKFFPVSISAGALEDIDGVQEYELISISDKLLGKYARSKKIIILRVNGESMNNIIPDGSYIIVDTSKMNINDIKDNDIVVFCENGCYSVKRYLNDPGNNRFLFKPDSTNGTFTPIEIKYENSSDLKLIGKVVKYLVDID